MVRDGHLLSTSWSRRQTAQGARGTGIFQAQARGCVASWVSRSHDGQPMFLVQTWYKDEAAWRRIAEQMEKAMGEQDAFEHLLSGPPLVGAFEGPNDDFSAPPHDA